MKKILTKKFFRRPTGVVAEDLLGKFLVRVTSSGLIEGMITEVEIYDGPKDLASHAARGKTIRTTPMFEEGGIFYVYFTYGLHYLLNVVTGEKEYPAAILIRATDKVSGPARLTKYFQIDKKFNGLLASQKSGLYFEDRGVKILPRQIKKTPRIGVDYAGPVWSKKKYRYCFESKT